MEIIELNMRAIRFKNTLPWTPKVFWELDVELDLLAIACYWPHANVVGHDITPDYITTAKKFFGSTKADSIVGLLQDIQFTTKFDLIVLMDVYEHIEVSHKLEINSKLADLIDENAKIILTVPTPRYLDWLIENRLHDRIQKS